MRFRNVNSGEVAAGMESPDSVRNESQQGVKLKALTALACSSALAFFAGCDDNEKAADKTTTIPNIETNIGKPPIATVYTARYAQACRASSLNPVRIGLSIDNNELELELQREAVHGPRPQDKCDALGKASVRYWYEPTKTRFFPPKYKMHTVPEAGKKINYQDHTAIPSAECGAEIAVMEEYDPIIQTGPGVSIAVQREQIPPLC